MASRASGQDLRVGLDMGHYRIGEKLGSGGMGVVYKAEDMRLHRFVDHRGLVANFPWGALARLGQARAYALQGDTAKARSAYQDFLALWEDADLDIPILKEAKTEYAKLQ